MHITFRKDTKEKVTKEISNFKKKFKNISQKFSICHFSILNLKAFHPLSFSTDLHKPIRDEKSANNRLWIGMENNGSNTYPFKIPFLKFQKPIESWIDDQIQR